MPAHRQPGTKWAREHPADSPAEAAQATVHIAGLHRVLAASGPITSHVRPRRHRLPAHATRQEIRPRFQI
jgi:hypothetical protein